MILALAAIAAPAVSAASEVECGAAPEAVIGLDYVSRYSDDDASRATIDPRLEAEAEAAVAPVDAFILTLAEGVDLIYTSPVKDRPANAECVLDQLVEWADADALSDLRTETVRLTVGSRHAAFALILWQTLPYAHDHPARERILAWLERRMREQMVFWEDAPEGARQGNLRAWAGLAAAALSVQTGDEELSRWAETAISDVMCSANADGSLPQEMSRGRLALHYQLHAVAPLVTAAALLERQGVPASRDCDEALHRIVDFCRQRHRGWRENPANHGYRTEFLRRQRQVAAFPAGLDRALSCIETRREPCRDGRRPGADDLFQAGREPDGALGSLSPERNVREPSVARNRSKSLTSIFCG